MPLNLRWLKSIRLKKFAFSILIALSLLGSRSVLAQVTIQNYAFSTNNNAALYTPINPVQIFGPNQDNETSAPIVSPFIFGFAGSLHTTFAVSTSGAVYPSYTQSVNRFLINPFLVEGVNSRFVANGMGTSKTGSISYFTVGVRPFRKLVIDYKNMALSKAAGDEDANFQAVICESTGAIEFLYGKMQTAVLINSSNGCFVPSIGTSSPARYQRVNTATHTSTYGTSLPNSGYAPGIITNLNSTGANSCRQYIFTAPQVGDFSDTQLTIFGEGRGFTRFSAVQPGGASGLYFIADSVVGESTPFASKNFKFLVSDTYTATAFNKSYYLGLYYSNGASISTNFATNIFTPSVPGIQFNSVKNGDWQNNITWGNGTELPQPFDTVTISAGDTVSINSFFAAAFCSELIIDGLVDFGNSPSLSVFDNITINASGKLWANNLRQNGYNINSSTGKIVSVGGSIQGAGEFDGRIPGSTLSITDNKITAPPHNIDVNFKLFNGLPILDKLTVQVFQPINLLKPVTIVQEVIGFLGTMNTNDNLSLDHLQTVSFFTPNSIRISRSGLQPLFNGAVNHSSNPLYNVDLSYLRRLFIPLTDPAVPGAYIAGNEIPASGRVNNLTVSDGVSVVINKSLTMNNDFTLSGNVNLGNNDLDCTAGRLVYFQGGIETTGTIYQEQGEVIYPIKNNGLKKFALLTSTASYAVKYVPLAGNTTFTTPYTEAGINFTARSNSYWEVTPLVIDFVTNNKTISLRSSGFPNVIDFTKFGISKETGSFNAGIHSTATQGNNDVTANRVGLLPSEISGRFYLAFDAATTLPVNNLLFNVTKQERRVKLSWTTNAESNNKGFIVQKSTNNSRYETIGFVEAIGDGNSIQESTYSFFDETPNKGINYYRIIQQDKDSREKYSEIKSVMFTDLLFDFVIAPNVTNTFTTINNINASPSNPAFMTVLSSNGQRILSKILTTNSYQLSVENFAVGTYYVSIKSADGFVITKRLVKM